VKKKRPEETFNSVTDYFDEATRNQYALSKNIMRIQKKITLRALELLNIEKSKVNILDAGCGPGFASFYLRKLNYRVVALDLIPEFFLYYEMERINPITSDMCLLPFKPNTFDAIISISALQWIFRDQNNVKMRVNLINLIKSFHFILKPETRAVLQFYPKSSKTMESIGKLITDSQLFSGNFVIDNLENPKKRKVFLILEK
jgi:18S rRNA (guanine1575-N7)-methyltransferase